MGTKVSCEARWCTRQAEIVCKCSGLKLCYNCIGAHMRDNPQVRHETAVLNSQPEESEGSSETLSPASLVYNKNVYRSPEGSTEVYEGQIKNMPQKVAIKIMYCRSEAELKKKQEEAKLQTTMKHPNICSCLGSFIDQTFQGGFKFLIVMEFSDVGDVEQEIESRKLRNDPWEEKELLNHMGEIIDAFAYLQENNLTHGDVKPRNLFITSEGKMKVGDFGESRQGVQALVTRTYQVTGTVIYFSPLVFKSYLEIIKGRNSTGEVRHNPIKSDVYSLGLSFLHMASFAKPTDLNNLEIGIQNLQNNVERAIAKLKYSEAVKKLLSHMLQVQENKRYDFKQLRNYINDSVISSTLNLSAVLEPEETNFETPRTRRSLKPKQKFSSSVLVGLPQMPGKVHILDLQQNSVSKISSHRFQPSARVCLVGVDIIITGGIKSPTSAFKFSIETNAVVKLSEMQEGRAWHAVSMLGENIYVIGGRSSDKRKCLKSCEVLAQGSWSPMSSLNEERENATAVAVNESIYVVGGSNKQKGRWELISSIEKFHQGTWQVLAYKLPAPMAGVGLWELEPGKVLMLGGSRERSAFSEEVFVWDLESQEFSQTTPLQEGDAFWSHSATEETGKVYLMGSLLGVAVLDRERDSWELKRY